MKLVKDQFVKCIENSQEDWFISGRFYKVKVNNKGLLYITSEYDTKWFQSELPALSAKGFEFEPADPSPLKVGDLVEVVRAPFASSNLKEGDRLTVTEVTGDGDFVNLIDSEGNTQECWYADRFKIISRVSTEDIQQNDLKKALKSALNALNEYETAKINLDMAQDKLKSILEGSK